VSIMMDMLKDERFESDKLRMVCQQVKDHCYHCAKNTRMRVGYHPAKSVDASLPMDKVVIDLLSLEGSRQGYFYVLVIVDVFSKFTWLRALKSKMAKEVAEKLYHIFCDFGFPKVIQSDNGREFVNAILKEWMELAEIGHHVSTPYYPQCNGITERMNSSVLKVLKGTIKGRVHQWEQFIPLTQMYINCRTSRTHRSAPFALVFARRFNPFEDYKNVKEGVITLSDWKKHLEEMTSKIYPEIGKNLDEYKKRLKKSQDEHHKLLEDLPMNTKVMVLEGDGKRKNKLDDKFRGPFTVIRKNAGGAYELIDELNNKLRRNYTPSQIRVVKLPDEDERVYEVEKILNHKENELGELQYFVKWKGYPSYYNSWEPVDRFIDQECIRLYNRKLTQSIE
jgi:hypothetical protein